VAHRPYTRAVLHDLLLIDDPGDDAGWRLCAHALVAQWPPALPGQHRLTFEGGNLTLTLLFGDPAQTLPRAGFLADGFVGVGIPTQGLANHVAALARHAVGGARWWAFDADELRAAWRRAAFVIESRTPVSAQGASPLIQAIRKSGLPLRGGAQWQAWTGESRALVVGTGVAGAHVAYALARRGWRVTVLSDDTPTIGHVCAAVTPVVARDDDARARLTRAGVACAASLWRALALDHPAENQRAFWICGTVQVNKPAGRAGDLADTLAHLRFPPGWVRAVDREAASRLAGLPLTRAGLYFSQGMRVRPDVLVAQLLSHRCIDRITGQVARLVESGRSWQALDAGGAVLASAPQVILATAGHTPPLLAASGFSAQLPVLSAMQRLGGEVMLLPAADFDGGPACVVAGQGYLLPALAGSVLAGSTYVRGTMQTRVSVAGQQMIGGKLQGLVAPQALAPTVAVRAQVSAGAPAVPLWPGWAGWRAVVVGRLPQIGAVPQAPGLWLATAFGSRGLTWAPLAAEMIAGALAGEPDILDTDLARQVTPR
jgi:tRNA 5-methylaminomethyl-2-thiouridine biosynthesis bifunctional protein